MIPEKENLKELLGKFLPPHEAAEAEYNIQQGENIFHTHPAPQPSERLLYLTKTNIAAKLNYQKVNSLRRIVLKAAAVAALFAIITYLTTFFYKNDHTKYLPTASIIQAGDFFSDDQEISLISSEVEQISNDMTSLTLEQNGSADNENIIDLEMNLIEVNGSFWKG